MYGTKDEMHRAAADHKSTMSERCCWNVSCNASLHYAFYTTAAVTSQQNMQTAPSWEVEQTHRKVAETALSLAVRNSQEIQSW